MSTNAAEVGLAGRIIPEWSLGDRLRKIRRVAGLSQSDFAKNLGENQKTYASWELDTTSPRNAVAVAMRIEAMTGVPAAWVLGLDAPGPRGGVVTEVDTRRYRVASSGRPGPLVLVTDSAPPYPAVASGYGSSGPGGGRSASPNVGRSARTVNNANAA